MNAPETLALAAAPERALNGLPVAAVLMRALLADCRRTGVPTAPLLEGWVLGPPDLEGPQPCITQAEALTFVRRAARLLPEPRLGLRLGAQSRITELGLLGLGMLASPTLGQATALCLRHARHTGLLMQLGETLAPGRHALVASPLAGSHDLQPLLADHALASLVAWRRTLAGPTYGPLEVHFVRPRPTDAAPYEQFYGCPVHFGRGENRLVDLPAWSDHPLPLASASALRLAAAGLQQDEAHLDPAAALADAVERAIRRTLPLTPSPEQLAAMFRQSERTLRRRLAEEGTSYRLLVDAARKARALELLVAGRRSISEAAEATGFVDKRNFRRAFKRWTGGVPSEAA